MAAFSKPSSVVGMLFTVVLLLQSVAASHGHMHHAHRAPSAVHKRGYNGTNIVVTGATDQHAYPRLEIRELQKNADQFNLYLLALESFQAKDKTDLLSYYQIAGIHGRPYIPWNEPGPLQHVAGYCPHVQTLFGTWHRPYLALYEQALYANAKEIVASFSESEQAKWTEALTGLRMPYFDWAMEPSVSGEYVPQAIRDEKVYVIKPSGNVSINNPLFSYSFGTSLPTEMGWGPSNGFPQTLRSPKNDVSDNDSVNKAFGSARVGWRQRVFALFASKQPWGKVSTEQYGVATSAQNTDSYESVHDEIHGAVGGTDGYMGYLDVAAFDPIFWLHHTNMDRLLTLHQVIAPDTWVANGTINIDTAQWNVGEVKDEHTPLKPFMKDSSGAYFTSNDVKETRTLGYYYPETANNDYNEVVAAVNKLYGQGEKAMASVATPSSTPSATPSATAAATAAAEADSSPDHPSSKSGSSMKISEIFFPSSLGGSIFSSTKRATSTGAGLSVSMTVGSSPSKSTSATGLVGGIVSGLLGTVDGAVDGVVSALSEPFPGKPFQDGDYDTVLNIVGNKFGMPGSYKVFCFLGNKPVSNSTNSTSTGSSATPTGSKSNSTVSSPPVQSSKNATASATDYYNHPDYAGSHTFLGGSVAKANATNPILTEGTIPLTACLQGKIASGDLESLHPEHVEPYLKDNLHYKIIGPNGQEFQPENVPNFQTKVKSCPVSAAKEGGFPSYQPYVELPKVNLPASSEPFPVAPVVSTVLGTIGSLLNPWDEQGYCVSSQTIEYVDQDGNFIRRETS
ncbi:Di-copper centre-containing protein [Massarina eburnea CBS 473.64]|uniref:tyrosinase n=1 Tax=Massarina eburnea CBS 473.64 TaxID=1395130 RepID=A0A6A6S3A1_9PLEO|nr:Di-copper centre-containing protein [Massarina eburnea CBS 473.64]